MKILVINAGSSSLKYQLIDMTTEEIIAKGNCERIGVDGLITHRLSDGTTLKHHSLFSNHTQAFEKLVELLTTGETAVVNSLDEISAIGHRVVQGGKSFAQSVPIDANVLKKIEQNCELAPLHNPAHILAIQACTKVFSNIVPQVAVFDTAFHQTMPPKAYLYGLDYKYYEMYNIRKYGFHGTSHRYVSSRFGDLSGGLQGKKIVTCHLGNGSSIAAIEDGKSVDTSMGFTPLDGLIMGTRAGNIDVSAVLYLMKKEQLTPDQMNDILNKSSGFLGVSGVSSDSRDLIAAAQSGNEHAQHVIAMFRYQIKKFIGSYAAAMGGLDGIVFTGGIGENSDQLRKEVCENMDFLGVEFDVEKNMKSNQTESKISTEHSRVAVWVIPTNEELLIARDTMKILKNN